MGGASGAGAARVWCCGGVAGAGANGRGVRCLLQGGQLVLQHQRLLADSVQRLRRRARKQRRGVEVRNITVQRCAPCGTRGAVRASISWFTVSSARRRDCCASMLRADGGRRSSRDCKRRAETRHPALRLCCCAVLLVCCLGGSVRRARQSRSSQPEPLSSRSFSASRCGPIQRRSFTACLRYSLSAAAERPVEHARARARHAHRPRNDTETREVKQG